MEDLLKQVKRVRRRLYFRRFLIALGWCWFITLLAATVTIAVEKFYPFYPDYAPYWQWAAGTCGLALAVGLLLAVAWALLKRGGMLQAAIDLDRRFALKERVSSTLAMADEDRQSEAGQALAEDARRKVKRLHVAGRFGISPGRAFLLPFVPAMIALLVALFVPPAVDEALAAVDPALVKKQVKKSTDVLRRKMADRRKQAKELGLKDAERLFKKLEVASENMGNSNTQRKKALVELNDYARQLKERRKRVAGADGIRKQLDKINDIKKGPAKEFAKAVARGDFAKAVKELEKLKEQLNNSKLDDEQKKKLAEQLNQIKEKLNDMAKKQEEAKKDLQQRGEQLKQAGQTAEADRLQEQLDKLLEQQPQMDQLQDLAEQLGQCSKCLNQGQSDKAAQSLQNLQAQLNNLKQQLDEMDMLDQAMEQLSDARSQMTCGQCQGAGCGACQGNGEGEGEGDGMGRGRGRGARPEEDSETAAYDTHARQKVGSGTADVTFVDGPNTQGKVEEAIELDFQEARDGSTDPLTGQRMPRKHRRHAREYFDRFREGE
ncbi:hypothetical protein ES707_09512 [subsurface metagenome]